MERGREQIATAGIVDDLDRRLPPHARADDLESRHTHDLHAAGPGDPLRRRDPDPQPRKRARTTVHRHQIGVGDAPAQLGCRLRKRRGDPPGMGLGGSETDLRHPLSVEGGNAAGRQGGIDGDGLHGIGSRGMQAA